MIAYKCDICEKFYERPSDPPVKIDPVTGSETEFELTGMVFAGPYSAFTRNYDVCPDCMRYFRKIIKEIKLKK